MEPHDRMRYTFYNLLRKILISIGHNFFCDGGFKPTFYTIFLYGLNALGVTSCIYTLIWYDVSTGLNAIGYGAINIQVKLVLFFIIYFFFGKFMRSIPFFSWLQKF